MAWKKVGRDAGRKDYNGSKRNRIFVYGAGYAPVFTKRNPLYKKFGFYEIESYNDSPLDTSIYMKLDL